MVRVTLSDREKHCRIISSENNGIEHSQSSSCRITNIGVRVLSVDALRSISPAENLPIRKPNTGIIITAGYRSNKNVVIFEGDEIKISHITSCTSEAVRASSSQDSILTVSPTNKIFIYFEIRINRIDEKGVKKIPMNRL